MAKLALKQSVKAHGPLVFRKFQIHHCTLWRNQKPQLSGKREIVEQNGVKFGTLE